MNLLEKTDNKQPNLDRLSMLDDTGGRRYIYPADASGRWSRIKPWVYLALIAIYVLLPWWQVDGRPAVLVDIAHRQFFFFGLTFNAQDFYIAFFFVSGIGFALIVVAALFGRVWCGWACPQTVFLDGVFRRVERWIEGPAHKRRKLAAAPLGVEKILRKGFKHAIYAVLASLIAHVFLSYFVGVEALLAVMEQGPGASPSLFAFTLVFTLLIYGNFWWFREQLCIVICPYGRLQSVLQDEDTYNVQYDVGRGEPRGKLKDLTTTGDCVDCFRCVQVCPTGIDIRNGHQLECIGCMYCIDACNTVMDKVGKPRGLIRFDTQRAVETGKRRFVRPRLLIYGVAGLVGLAVAFFVIGKATPFEANVLRAQGAPYELVDGHLQNALRVHVVNKQAGPTTMQLVADPAQAAWVLVPQPRVTLDSFGDHDLPVFIRVPAADYAPGLIVHLSVHDSLSGETRPLEVRVLGPPNPIRTPANPPTTRENAP